MKPAFDKRVSASTIDRRAEDREPASGEVIMALVAPGAPLLRARLVDISAQGFRAAYDSASLPSGSIVRFRHARTVGTAKVVWNRTVGDKWESGFLILEIAPYVSKARR
jgi:hypothetical protein